MIRVMALTPAQIKEARRLFASENGKKGSAARAAALTPENRKAIAQKAAKARWDNTPRKPKPEKK